MVLVVGGGGGGGGGATDDDILWWEEDGEDVAMGVGGLLVNSCSAMVGSLDKL